MLLLKKMIITCNYKFVTIIIIFRFINYNYKIKKNASQPRIELGSLAS